MKREESRVSLYELIQWGLAEHTERELAALPLPEEIDAALGNTADFRRRVLAEVKRRRKKAAQKHPSLRVLKRTLMVAAILLSILFATLMSNAAVRAAVINTMIEWTNRDLAIRFEVEGEPLKELPAGYGPRYIPEGLTYQTEASYQESDGTFFAVYESTDGKKILDIQVTIAQNGSGYFMDREHLQYEKIVLQQVPAYYDHGTSESGDEINTLLWVKDGMEHFIYTNLDENELFRIAENIA